MIDLFEEARGVELDERLATGDRGRHRSADLLRAATSGGADALGWPDAGRLEPGARADFVTVGLDSVRLAGTPSDQVVGSLVFAATAADVRQVVVGGEVVVRDGRHATIDVAAELAAAIGCVGAMSALVVDHIGLLVTNDPTIGEGPLGIVRDAAPSSRATGSWRSSGPASRRRTSRRRRLLRDPGLRRQPHAPGVRR